MSEKGHKAALPQLFFSPGGVEIVIARGGPAAQVHDGLLPPLPTCPTSCLPACLGWLDGSGAAGGGAVAPSCWSGCWARHLFEEANYLENTLAHPPPQFPRRELHRKF